MSKNLRQRLYILLAMAVMLFPSMLMAQFGGLRNVIDKAKEKVKSVQGKTDQVLKQPQSQPSQSQPQSSQPQDGTPAGQPPGQQRGMPRAVSSNKGPSTSSRADADVGLLASSYAGKAIAMDACKPTTDANMAREEMGSFVARYGDVLVDAARKIFDRTLQVQQQNPQMTCGSRQHANALSKANIQILSAKASFMQAMAQKE